jgi:Tfp pilus assembly protein PilN
MTTLINLLPDLRQAKLRERRRRQLVTGLGFTVWIACGAIVVIMLVVSGGQKLSISNYTKSIAAKQAELRAVDGLVEALTANQHLASLPGLYDKRVYMTKFFEAYSQADPASITLSSLAVDNVGVLTVLGTAPSFAEVAKLARALEASNVTVGPGAAENNAPYFSNVSINSVDSGDRAGVSFSVSATLQSGVTSVVE